MYFRLQLKAVMDEKNKKQAVQTTAAGSKEGPREGIVWLKLNDESINKLKAMYPPLYPNEYYHHVTLVFGTQRSLFEEIIGRDASVVVHAYARDQNAEAVRVHTNELPDTYGVPHITLSTQRGVKPFASVLMLQGDHHEEQVDQFELSGKVEFIPL